MRNSDTEYRKGHFEVKEIIIIIILNPWLYNRTTFRYISDHAFEGYSKLLQKKCLSWNEDSTGRTYPPSLIEWKALKENARLSLNCYMPDGEYIYKF